MSQPKVDTEWKSEFVHKSGDITEEDLVQPVHDFHFAVQPDDHNEQPLRSNYHVSQLLLVDGDTAVRINMHRPNLEGSNELFQVEKHRRPTYGTSFRPFTYPSVQGPAVTVRMVIDTLLEHQFHRYTLARGGDSDIYWQYVPLPRYLIDSQLTLPQYHSIEVVRALPVGGSWYKCVAPAGNAVQAVGIEMHRKHGLLPRNV